MGSSYHHSYTHFVFSTKHRKPLILPDYEKRLWSYICGIGKNNGYQIVSIGGVEDHLHILLSLSTTKSISKTIQEIKGNSSKWMNDTFYTVDRRFNWQKGYGSFFVCKSGIDKVEKYIQNQKEHHKKMTFKEEFKWFLDYYEIEYDERYLWD